MGVSEHWVQIFPVLLIASTHIKTSDVFSNTTFQQNTLTQAIKAMTFHWYDFVGNIGVFLILLAYFLLQSGRLSNLTVKFNLLNLTGAGFILLSLCFEFNLSAFIIEFFWLLISLGGLIKSYRNLQASR